VHALTTLPREQREVIVLKIWHRYTFQQISQLLELSPNTVAGRYRYGLVRLKSALKGINDENSRSLRATVGRLDPASTICESP
jgi:RNA polymerase sigma-70 factor (ECF subfamily)